MVAETVIARQDDGDVGGIVELFAWDCHVHDAGGG